MSWYVALLFNFLSSLTALAGFFVGVSVGLLSQLANGWMLALAAGTFLYVSLVDLVCGHGGLLSGHRGYYNNGYVGCMWVHWFGMWVRAELGILAYVGILAYNVGIGT